MPGCPFSKGRRATCLVQQGYKNTKHNQKYENTHIPGIGKLVDHTALFLKKDRVDHLLQVEIRVQQSTRQNSGKQGGVHLLRHKCQSDRDHRRQQGKNCRIRPRLLPCCPRHPDRDGQQHGKNRKQREHCKLFLFHFHITSPHLFFRQTIQNLSVRIPYTKLLSAVPLIRMQQHRHRNVFSIMRFQGEIKCIFYELITKLPRQQALPPPAAKYPLR